MSIRKENVSSKKNCRRKNSVLFNPLLHHFTMEEAEDETERSNDLLTEMD